MKEKLSSEAKKARNAYQRAWNAKNKDKVREYRERYWQRKAEALAATIAEAKELKRV
jgi:hypothetical protein